MSLETISQISGPISNVLLGAVFAVGYYIIIRLYRQTLDETREQRLSGGRPQVIVQADYDRLPEIGVTVRNVSGGAAREISFEFSNPIENSEGYVISDLPYFKEGLDFLEPGGEITCYWDSLDNLIPMFKENKYEGGIAATVRYESIAGESYTSRWKINPLLFEGYQKSSHKSMEDLVEVLEKLSTDIERLLEHQEEARKRGVPDA